MKSLLTSTLILPRCILVLLLSHFSHVRLCVTPQTAATRLSCPWDSPGKNTGVGCHFLLQCMKVKSEREVAQSCLTLSDPMDCSLPGSSIHGIFQAKYWSGVPLPSTMKDLIGKSHKSNLKGLLAITFLYYFKTTFYFYHFSSFIEPLWYIKYEKKGLYCKKYICLFLQNRQLSRKFY